MAITTEILVAGGGMAGLTAAVAFAGAGVPVLVVDTAPAAKTAPGYDGRTSAIAYGSMRVLDGIGLWADLAKAAEPITDIRVSDGPSRLFVHYDHRDIGDAPLGYILENATIHAALAKRLDALNVRRIAGRVAAIDTQGVRATATLETGETIRAALIVGADGRRSAVRKLAHINVTDWRYRQTSIVCAVDHEKPHRGVAHERFLPGGVLALLPMHGNRSSVVWSEASDLVPAMMALSAEDFAAEIERRFGPHLGRMTLASPRWAYPLGLTHAECYVADRLALVGDAAHAIHPIAGQGFNLGLRDVAALAEVVIDARRLGLDAGDAEALARYERWRRFDSTLLVAVTDALTRLFATTFPPAALARRLGLGAVEEIPAAKRFFMRHAMGMVGDLPRLVRGEAL